jgi:hypothetical protein
VKAAVRVALLTAIVYALIIVEPELFFVQAQHGNGTVAGVVVSTAGRNVTGARVFVQSADGGKATTELTNRDGRFFFPQIRSGLYNLRANYRGQWSDWERNVEVRNGHQTEVRLKLKRPDTKKS